MFQQIIGGIVQGAAGTAQAGVGLWQYLKGKREAEALERPEYIIPAEIQQNLTQAELRALEGLPAEQKQLYVENIQRGMTAGLRGLQDRGLGVAGVSSLVQQQTDAYRELLGMDVGAKLQAEQNLATARGTMAGFKDVAFDINQMQPHIQDYLQAQAMMGSGMQNIYGGGQTIAASGQTFAGGMGGAGGGGFGGGGGGQAVGGYTQQYGGYG